jgi:hypothetical protein
MRYVPVLSPVGRREFVRMRGNRLVIRCAYFGRAVKTVSGKFTRDESHALRVALGTLDAKQAHALAHTVFFSAGDR